MYVGQLVAFTLGEGRVVRGVVAAVSGITPEAYAVVGEDGEVYEMGRRALSPAGSQVPLSLRFTQAQRKTVRDTTARFLRMDRVKGEVDAIEHPKQPEPWVRIARVATARSAYPLQQSGATERGSLPWYMRPLRLAGRGGSRWTQQFEQYLTGSYRRAVAELAEDHPNYWEVYTRRMEMGDTYATICRDLGISRELAWKWKERAVELIRRRMDAEDADDGRDMAV